MSTTSIFIELFIGGIQASLWIALLFASITGLDWVVKIIPNVEKWGNLLTIIVFAFWYALGIIVDRIARIFSGLVNPAKIAKKIKFVQAQVNKTARDSILAETIVKGGNSYDYIEYYRVRGRIVRATIFNIVLTTIAAIIFVSSQCAYLGCSANQSNIILIIIGIGFVMFIMAFVASAMLELASEVRIIQVRKIISEPNKVTKPHKE